MIHEYSPPLPIEHHQQPEHLSSSHDLTSPTISPTNIGIASIDNPFHAPSNDFTSPSFFDPESHQGQYDPSPSDISRHPSYDSNASFGHDFSSYGSVPSTSHSMQSFGGGDDGGPGAGYWGYGASSLSSSSAGFTFGHAEGDGSGLDDQPTPPAHGQMDDDRTPVAPSHPHHQPIHPSQLPSPHDAATIRASSSSSAPSSSKPLLSPFRSFGHQQHPHEPSFAQFPSMQINDPNAFMDPNNPHAYYQHQLPQTIPPLAYHSSFGPSYNPMPIGYAQAHQHVGYSQPIFAPQPQQPSYGPPRSHNGSPTGSMSSMAGASVKRSQSISSDVRPPRPKLTKEDKRNIVELHRNNTNLRQEDIARRYGVDRSTISKIIIAKHRWTATEEDIPSPPMTRPPKSTSGRFPEVDRMMSEWMDQQISIGADVRDPIAREQAKVFALQVGLDDKRFKASAKWLDKFKDRRKAAGKPITSSSTTPYNPQQYTTLPQLSLSYPNQMQFDSAGRVRSHSAMTYSEASSSASSQEHWVPSPACIPADRIVYNRSDTDLNRPTLPSAPSAFSLADREPSSALPAETTPQARARSQSSPNTLVGNVAPMQTPASGKHVRPSPLSLQRQNSYHGSSPSPRRPLPPSRANSSQGPLRRSRPGSLAASAFGITSLDGDGPYSPIQSPTTSTSGSIGGHSRQQSQLLTPFTASMATMALSPDVPESGDLLNSTSTTSSMGIPTPLAVPPHTPVTPITPANASTGGVFPTLNPDLSGYGDHQQAYQHHHQQLQQQQLHHHQIQQAAQANGSQLLSPHEDGQGQLNDPPLSAGRMGHAPLQGYATMPNKHYGSTGEYPGYSPVGEFGQQYSGQMESQGYQGSAGSQSQRWS